MKPVFIVEGHSDARQIIGALGDCGDYKIIVTDGTKVNNSLIMKIEEATDNGYVPYVLSDPDIAGEHLYNMILYHFPNIKRIEADYEECKYCKDIRKKKFKAGIEYSSYRYLIKLLGGYVCQDGKIEQENDSDDLWQENL